MRRLGFRVLSVFLILTMLTDLAGGLMPAEAAVIRPFTVRFTRNTTGAITMTGNTVLTCPTSATGCTAARTGTGSSTTANNNNNFVMTNVDIDGDPTTFNSSRNTLNIPSSSTVLFAGLYWGADTTAGTGGTAAPTPTARGQVLLRGPSNSGYVPINASQVDTSPVTGGVRYQGFADVTSTVSAGRSGEYTVANVQAGKGNDRYGGWALVVALQDAGEPLRNLTIFDGYAVVQQTPTVDQNVAIPVSGFVTPPSGAVRSRVGVVAYEGDLGLTGDSLRLNSTSLANSLNPATNFFNSSLTGFNTTNTTGDPFQTNMLGFDIDTINADGVLANSATSAMINLNTTSDTYFPGVVSFSTELFSPRLDLAKSASDVNGGSLDTGDEVLYNIVVTNNGDDGANKVVVTDEIPANSTYVSGSLIVDGRAVTDGSGDDTGELASGPPRIVARLGAGANASTGGTLPIGATRTISFRVRVGTLPVDAVLTNTAKVSYSGVTSGLSLEGGSNAALMTPRPHSDLSVLKFGPSDRVTVPGTTSFRLLVVNRGPAVEPTAVLTDTLPTGFVAVSASSSQGPCTLGVTITCNLGSIAVGETVVVDIDATVASGSGTVTNRATVSGANLDLFPNNNNASASVELNRPPVAVNQTASTTESTPVTIAVLTGASDLDGDTLTTVGTSTAGNGVVVNTDGTVTYTPNSGFKGTDTFTYTISDGSATATANVTVTVANAPPLAVDDWVATLPSAPVTVNVLANDSDPNSDLLSITEVTPPAGGATTGSVINNGNGTVTFTPNAAFRGTASFTYTVTDGTDTATANVRVLVPDAAPVAVDDFATTASNTPVIVSVLANDLDDNNDPLFITVVTQPAGGSAAGVVADNGNGTLTFTPSAAFRGTAIFTYSITDLTSTATANVSVTVENAPPVVGNDDVSTLPATAIDIDVLANDSDANGDALIIVDTSNPANGTVTLGAGNIITYAPNPGFKGSDSFTYTVSDGTDTATATVTVTVPNGVPVGAADRRTTEGNSSVTIPVLANDYDPNDDPLAVVGVTSPASGTAIINGDSTITYTPSAGFKGIDTFTYTLSDGTDSATATVTITVANASPIAVDDTVDTLADTPIVIPVLSNDSDPNGDSLSLLSVTQPASGAVVVNANGTVTYTPNAIFKGSDTFTYTVTDGSATATGNVTVNVADAGPIAVDDTIATLPATPVTVNVLANDSDPNGDPLSVTAVTQPVGGAATGVAVRNANGTVTFTPHAAFRGTATFTYTISDGSSTATASVSVIVPDAAPVAVDDFATTASNTPVIVRVLDNDLDDNGDLLTVTAVTQPTGGAATGVVVTSANDTVTFTPAAAFRGEALFTYTITDGTTSASANVSVMVGNAAPIAAIDNATTTSGVSVVIDVLANDSDANGDSLLIVDSTSPANGTATLGAGNLITYTPNPGFKGSDTFTYTISDGLDFAVGTVTVTIPNRPPVANPDVRDTAANTPIVVNALANDTDPDADVLTVIGVSAPSNGVVLRNADNTIRYTPNTSFKGTDTFSYTVWDGTDSASAVVTINVANAAPVAVNDAVATLPATAVTVNVLANDSDPNGDSLTVSAVTQPAGGAATGVVVNNAGATVTFTPDAAFRGTATFTYTVFDGTDSSTASVSVTVPDAAPVAVDDFAATASNTPVTVNVLANDLDDNGDPLTVLSITQPTNGTAVNNGDGTVTYTPNSTFKGDDTFTYNVTDGGATASASVTIRVANAIPLAVDDAATTPPAMTVVIDVLANDTDLNGDTLSVITFTDPANGSVAVNSDGRLSYAPDPGFLGTDTFTYTITDGVDWAIATVTVTVTAFKPDNTPVVVPDSDTTPADTPAIVPVVDRKPAPGVDPDRTTPERLAFTGANILLLLASGSALLVIGSVLLSESRRRPTRR